MNVKSLLLLALSLFISQVSYAQCSNTYATISVSVCESYTAPSGKFWNTPGTLLDTIENVAGCDSIITINLTIKGYWVVTTFAGSTQGYVDSTGIAAKFSVPLDVALDAAGNLYVADNANHKIRKISPFGVVTTLAGSTQGYVDGTGTAAKFYGPNGVAIDSSGNVYVSDVGNSKIRKISPAGVVTTIAGSTKGYADGTGTTAKFYNPTGLAVDASGNVYVGDQHNHKIRKISPSGVVTTLAGSTQGYVDSTGTFAKFNNPKGVAVDALGNVYVADYTNHKIRKISPSGVVSTLAGSTQGYVDATGTTAKFSVPHGIALDPSGNVYVGDLGNEKIRKISPSGVVSTLAGSTQGYVDSTGTFAKFNNPYGVTVDASGNVYVVDVRNNRIRKITRQSTTYKTISPDACNTYTSPSGKLWALDGTYLDTIPNIAGCDSVIKINLKVKTININVMTKGDTLIAQQPNATYQWLDCINNNTPISGQTNATFVTTKTGEFAVDIAKDGCRDTSNCQLITNSGIPINHRADFALYPNPTNGMLRVSWGHVNNDVVELQIINSLGEIVMTQKVIKSDYANLDMQGLDKGFYVVRLLTNDHATIQSSVILI